MNARVLIDGPSELVFDYAIPAGLDVQPGCRVRVPLRRKSATGTVLSIGEPDAQAKWYYEIKRLWQKAQQDKTPFVNPIQGQTLHWVT